MSNCNWKDEQNPMTMENRQWSCDHEGWLTFRGTIERNDRKMNLEL